MTTNEATKTQSILNPEMIERGQPLIPSHVEPVETTRSKYTRFMQKDAAVQVTERLKQEQNKTTTIAGTPEARTPKVKLQRHGSDSVLKSNKRLKTG